MVAKSIFWQNSSLHNLRITQEGSGAQKGQMDITERAARVMAERNTTAAEHRRQTHVLSLCCARTPLNPNAAMTATAASAATTVHEYAISAPLLRRSVPTRWPSSTGRAAMAAAQTASRRCVPSISTSNGRPASRTACSAGTVCFWYPGHTCFLK